MHRVTHYRLIPSTNANASFLVQRFVTLANAYRMPLPRRSRNKGVSKFKARGRTDPSFTIPEQVKNKNGILYPQNGVGCWTATGVPIRTLSVSYNRLSSSKNLASGLLKFSGKRLMQ